MDESSSDSMIIKVDWTPKCISAVSESKIYLIDYDSDSVITSIKPPGSEELSCSTWNPDCQLNATGAFCSDTVHIYDASMISSSSSIDSPQVSIRHGGKSRITNSTVDWCPFLRGVLALAGMEENIFLWDAHTGVEKSIVETERVNSLCFNDNSKDLCSTRAIPLSLSPKGAKLYQNQMSIWSDSRSDSLQLSKRFCTGPIDDWRIDTIIGCKKTDLVASLSQGAHNMVQFWKPFDQSKKTVRKGNGTSVEKSFLNKLPELR